MLFDLSSSLIVFIEEYNTLTSEQRSKLDDIELDISKKVKEDIAGAGTKKSKSQGFFNL